MAQPPCSTRPRQVVGVATSEGQRPQAGLDTSFLTAMAVALWDLIGRVSTEESTWRSEAYGTWARVQLSAEITSICINHHSASHWAYAGRDRF